MMNPLFSLLGGNNVPQLPGGLGNLQNLMQQFNQFKSTFQGNPQQQVQGLLNSGRMSQAQFNQLQKMAQQLQSYFK